MLIKWANQLGFPPFICLYIYLLQGFFTLWYDDIATFSTDLSTLYLLIVLFLVPVVPLKLLETPLTKMLQKHDDLSRWRHFTAI